MFLGGEGYFRLALVCLLDWTPMGSWRILGVFLEWIFQISFIWNKSRLCALSLLCAVRGGSRGIDSNAYFLTLAGKRENMLNFSVHFFVHCYCLPSKILECLQGTYSVLSVIQKEIAKHAQLYQLMLFIIILRIQGRWHHRKVISAVYDS